MNNDEDPPSPFASAPRLYGDLGWALLPLQPRTKNAPLIKWRAEASCQPSDITTWADRWPMANVAVACRDQLVVIDVDPRHGGIEAVARLEEEHGVLPETPTVETGGGGLHYYFRPPAGVTLGNRTGALPEGIDIRGNGGYVVAPPSVHPDGGRYRWREARSPEDVGLAQLPNWIIALVQQGGSKAMRSTGHVTEARAGKEPLADHEDGLIPVGRRHVTLASLAGTMRRKGMSAAAIEAALLEESRRRCEVPLPEDEVRRIAADIGAKPSGVLAAPVHEGELEEALQRSRPVIDCGARQLIDIVRDAWRAILACNEPPVLFRMDNAIVRVSSREQRPAIEPITEQLMYSLLIRSAVWVRPRGDGLVDTSPRKSIAADMLTVPSTDLPELEEIVSVPTLDRRGHFVVTPGYHPEAKLWLHLHDDAEGLEVSVAPSATDVRAALELVLGEVLVDFPFVGEPDRVHALSAMLLPLVRRLIDGPTPLHLIEAPGPGTGKGLLADVISLLVTGEPAGAMTIDEREDENRKRITGTLLDSKDIVLIDNVPGSLASSNLAAVLTADRWRDRILGGNKMTWLKNRVLWMSTANNPQLSLEIARRSVRIRMDAQSSQPWTGRTFKHPALKDWTREHRRELLGALMTLVSAWNAAGRPLGQASLGSFESWARVISGVLEVVGVGGFLENAQELYANADAGEEGVMVFVIGWWNEHGDQWVQAQQLLGPAREVLPALETSGRRSQRSAQVALGCLLSKLRDRCLGPYRIEAARNTRSNSSRYRLVQTEAAVISPSGARSLSGSLELAAGSPVARSSSVSTCSQSENRWGSGSSGSSGSLERFEPQIDLEPAQSVLEVPLAAALQRSREIQKIQKQQADQGFKAAGSLPGSAGCSPKIQHFVVGPETGQADAEDAEIEWEEGIL